MMRSTGPGGEYFEDLVEQIFAEPDKQKALDLIDSYSTYWMEIVGTRGFKGKKALNGNAMFDQLFEVEGGQDNVVDSEPEFDESKLDALEAE
jgi:acetyl-CoA carboxylase alpha subunit